MEVLLAAPLASAAPFLLAVPAPTAPIAARRGDLVQFGFIATGPCERLAVGHAAQRLDVAQMLNPAQLGLDLALLLRRGPQIGTACHAGFRLRWVDGLAVLAVGQPRQ